MIKFAERIKELRETKNMTHVELAKQLNCSVGIISLWENDLRTPNAESIVAIAKYFEVSTDYLLGLED